MAFELPPLPYPPSALAERGMQQETLELHHGKHHQAYVTALNGFVEKDSSLQGKSLEDIIQMTYNQPDKAPVFNNAGQHWNHNLFWPNMSPQGGGIPGRRRAGGAVQLGRVGAAPAGAHSRAGASPAGGGAACGQRTEGPLQPMSTSGSR